MLTIGCHLSTTKGYRAMGETALTQTCKNASAPV